MELYIYLWSESGDSSETFFPFTNVNTFLEHIVMLIASSLTLFSKIGLLQTFNTYKLFDILKQSNDSPLGFVSPFSHPDC